uniref:Uncharacterized protein n=1 Tax=Arundo donax TaxID=35708 RepID=A0A0A9D4E9_ARUDO
MNKHIIRLHKTTNRCVSSHTMNCPKKPQVDLPDHLPLSNGSALAREKLLPGLHRRSCGDVSAASGLDLLLVVQLA